jgi:hypothetical protein
VSYTVRWTISKHHLQAARITSLQPAPTHCLHGSQMSWLPATCASSSNQLPLITTCIHLGLTVGSQQSCTTYSQQYSAGSEHYLLLVKTDNLTPPSIHPWQSSMKSSAHVPPVANQYWPPLRLSSTELYYHHHISLTAFFLIMFKSTWPAHAEYM